MSEALDKRVTEIGGNRQELLDWSADSSNPESWQSIKAELDVLERKKAKIVAKITERTLELDKHYAHEPKVDLDEVEDEKKKQRKNLIRLI